jgi:hypothetical protein
MKHRYLITTLLLIGILLSPIKHTKSDVSNIDFRSASFNNKGYDITYDIVQGENIENMFTDLGFDILDSLSGEFHVLLKDKSTEIQDIYMIESGKYIPTYESVYTSECYFITSDPVKVELNTSSEFLTSFIGYNYRPVESKIIQAELPVTSSFYIPNIFTNITRPNFASIVEEINYFDFLPIILNDNYERFEAEFASLVLEQSFSAKIYNQGYNEFTVSLDVDIEPAISMRASWDKSNGLLTSFSLHIIYGNKKSNLVLSLVEYKEIISPAIIPVKMMYITDSYANYTLYQQKNSTEVRLEEWKHFINLLNQTYGLRYSFARSGLEFDWNLYVFDAENSLFTQSHPLQNSIITVIPPALIPVWDRYSGMVHLIDNVWKQLQETLVGFQFIVSGVSQSLFTLRDANLRMEYFFEENIHHLIWEVSYDFQEINTLTLEIQDLIKEIKTNMTGWIAYTNEGDLIGVSCFFQEHFHAYYVPAEPDYGNNYHYEFYIKSIPENITIPEFTEVEKTSFTSNLLQIIFYSIIVIPIYRVRGKKKDKI